MHISCQALDHFHMGIKMVLFPVGSVNGSIHQVTIGGGLPSDILWMGHILVWYSEAIQTVHFHHSSWLSVAGIFYRYTEYKIVFFI